MNLPANTTSINIPAQLPPNVQAKLSAWGAELNLPSSGGRYLSVAAMPNDDQRAFLARRLAMLDSCTPPIAENVLRAQLQGTLGMLKGDRLSPEEVEFELRVYQSVLADMPAFAVIEACRDYLLNRRGDGWKPKPPELRKAAEDHLGKVVREKRQIEIVLAALPTPQLASAERRKKAADYARQVASTFEANFKRVEAERLGREAAPVAGQPEPEPDGRNEAARIAYHMEKLEGLKDKPLPKLSKETLELFRAKTQPSHHSEAAE